MYHVKDITLKIFYHFQADQDVSGILSDSNMEKIEELIKSGSKTDAVLIEVILLPHSG